MWGLTPLATFTRTAFCPDPALDILGKLPKLMRIVCVLLAALAIGSVSFAQSPVNGAANRKQATALRVPNGSIRVDGHLDEEIWLKAAPITDFTQKEPNEGAQPTD